MRSAIKKGTRFVTAAAGASSAVYLLARMAIQDFDHAGDVDWHLFVSMLSAVIVLIVYSRTLAFSTPAFPVPNVVAWLAVACVTAIVVATFAATLAVAVDPELFNRRALPFAATAWAWLCLGVLVLAGDRFLGPLRYVLHLGRKPTLRSLALYQRLERRMERRPRRAS